ncbi:hypothetical protein FA95DRAFT_1612804 [Auriscalpium vulgare]|uniref:Uncharacterized protein n=1 Tax=Auriscalpium vulgare TaxID=40419 RepID=A0ACB8R537_9AGAM|nr:hypothetical protein FA95DRAFT_1612804 [Auriscalpium vulgare]
MNHHFGGFPPYPQPISPRRRGPLAHPATAEQYAHPLPPFHPGPQHPNTENHRLHQQWRPPHQYIDNRAQYDVAPAQNAVQWGKGTPIVRPSNAARPGDGEALEEQFVWSQEFSLLKPPQAAVTQPEQPTRRATRSKAVIAGDGVGNAGRHANIPAEQPLPTPVVPSQAPHPPAPASPTSNAGEKAPLPTPAKTPANKKGRTNAGKGSKSGQGNRRDAGGSDDEILELTEAQMDAAALKVKEAKKTEPKGLSNTDKLKAVECITSPERWPTFRVNQHRVFIHIASVVLSKRVTPTQIRNYWWNQAWEKYKAVRIMSQHTGGGDGDADRQIREGKAKVRNMFSQKVLDAFEASRIYEAINKVAKDDASVVRHDDFSSARAVSDDDGSNSEHETADDEHSDSSGDSHTNKKSKAGKKSQKKRKRGDGSDDFSSMVARALKNVEARNKRQEKVDKIQLDLAKLHEERERQEFEERREQARRKAATEQWATAMAMVDHVNPLIRQQGERLVQRLTDEEERAVTAETAKVAAAGEAAAAAASGTAD